jgi:putative ABC transport system permease protein
MQTLWQDLRYGARLVVKKPGFAMIILLTLALGIGANTAIFSVVDAVLLRSMPYPEAERLVYLWSSTDPGRSSTYGSSLPDYREWRDHNRSFEELAGYFYGDYNISSPGGEAERIQGAYVTTNIFQMLRVSPAIGRLFLPNEDQFGQHRVALLSDGLWQRRFGSDPKIIGREIKIGGANYVVVGVMPAGMAFFDNTPQVELWTPLSFAPGDDMDTRGNHFVNLVGRLKPGVTIEQAQQDVSAIARRMEDEQLENKGLGAVLRPAQEEISGESRRPLYILLGAVTFVLLVACANIANLLLARAAAREREMAIRASLGASRGRILRQMAIECVPLGLLGGVLGTVLALWAIDLLSSMLPPTLPRHNEIGINGRVLGFTLVITVFTVLLFSLLPALHASKADVHAMLGEGGRGGVGGRRQGRLRRALVAAEIALALVLLIGAGLMVRSFIKLRQVDLGLTTRQVQTMRVPLPDAKYYVPINAEDRLDPGGLKFSDQLLARLEAAPGVKAATIATMLPLGAGGGWGKFLSIDGRPAPPSLAEVANTSFVLISPNYFRTFGIPVRGGRAFNEQDRGTSQSVAIINETLAKKHFPNENPVGRTIWAGPPEQLLPSDAQRPRNLFPRRVIVGVVADVKGANFAQNTAPHVYVPLHQHRLEGWSNSLMIAVETEGEPRGMVAAVRKEIRAIDPELPLTNVRTVDELITRSLSATKFSVWLLSLFAGVAFLLAGIGVYGVMSYAVTQRTREIGVRIALGAQTRDVLRMIVGQGAKTALAGIAVGLGASFALTRLLATLLFGVSIYDPLTYVAIAMSLFTVALLACYLPARRASKIDPMNALRQE